MDRDTRLQGIHIQYVTKRFESTGLFEKMCSILYFIVFEVMVEIIHHLVSNVPPSFSKIALQNFQGISDRFSEVSN